MRFCNRTWYPMQVGTTMLIAAMENALDLRRARIHELEQQLHEAKDRIAALEARQRADEFAIEMMRNNVAMREDTNE